jgi:hypothetical protein
MHARPATRHSEPDTGGHADSMAKSWASSMLLNIRRCRTRLNTDVLAHNPEVAGSCKELRRLISAGFQGCMSIPGWSGRWRRLGSEAGVMPGLADLIATAGLATDDPHVGSGSARLGWVWSGCST